MDTGAELPTLIVWTACWYIINSKARSYRSFSFHQTIGNICNPDWRKLYVKTFNPGLNLWIHINDCINPAIALGTFFFLSENDYMYVHIWNMSGDLLQARKWASFHLHSYILPLLQHKRFLLFTLCVVFSHIFEYYAICPQCNKG